MFYTDEFTSYSEAQRHGKHVPINHQETFGVGRAPHRRDRGVLEPRQATVPARPGVDPRNFPLYLAAYEFRYNHRGEHLMTLSYDRLIRTTVPTKTQP